MRIHSMLAVAALVALPATTQAAVLYVQAPTLESARTSDFGSASNGGFRMFDDFTLSTSASIEQVTWRGLWIGSAVVPAPAPAPDALSWDIAFYEDNGGLPGAIRASQILTPGQVTLTSLGAGVFNISGVQFNVVVYDLSVVLPIPVNVAGGTRYWFSPLAHSENFSPFFAWLGSDLPSSVGDDRSIQQVLGAGMSVVSTSEILRDRTFRLEGTASVPEPALTILLGTAAAGFVARRRRARATD